MIEFAGCIFPGDGHGEFDDLWVVKVGLHALEELVVDVTVAIGDRLGVFEGDAFVFAEEITLPPVLDGEQLLIGYAKFATSGSVDIGSEDAAIDLGDAAIEQAREFGIEEAGASEPGPHSLDGLEDGGAVTVGEVGEQWLVPLLDGAIYDGFKGRIHSFRICQLNADHCGLPFTSWFIFSWLNCGTRKLFVPHARSAAYDTRRQLVIIFVAEPG